MKITFNDSVLAISPAEQSVGEMKYLTSGLIFEKKLLKPEGWFILEHTPRNDYKSFRYYRTERKYGTTIFSIFINNIRETINRLVLFCISYVFTFVSTIPK